MSDHHCPFLNRADKRCSEHFNLDRLGYAFKYCCDRYHKCSTYSVLLSERQVRRVGQMELTVSSMRLADVRSPFVQVFDKIERYDVLL